MNFYKCILFIMYIYIEITKASKGDLKLLQTGLEYVSLYSVGLKFYVVVNNTSDDDRDVKLSPEQCCLKHKSNLDCDTMNIIGNCEENIPKGTKKTLELIAPVINPYGRHGYCIVSFNSKPKNRRNYVEKNTVKIDFNIQIDNKDQSMERPNYVKKCKNIDEDPLKFCEPVDCDVYYNGKKPYYKAKLKRCVSIPICISNFRSELPDAIYDPVSNSCIHGRSILDGDIEFIKTLDKPNKKRFLETNELRLINFNVNKFDNIMDDVDNSLTCSNDQQKSISTKINRLSAKIYKTFRSYILKNKFTIGILFTVVFIQCCLICALGYHVTNKCDCLKRKKAVRDLYNYNTDASMTTPLIFSNTNTDTTDYQYLSESSNNIIKKINCYKSCQREQNNDMRLSISDDILSKCLTRRDWIDNKYTKSEAISGMAAISTDTIPKIGIGNTKNNYDAVESSLYNPDKKGIRVTESTRKSCEAKVIFEDETSIKNNNSNHNNSIKEVISSSEDKNKGEKNGSDKLEKEIRSHGYDCFKSNDDVNKISPNSNPNNKSLNIKQAVSLSSNKGAQACFSNDSIDDFLSERGMIFLAGDDFSKYSFSCPSHQAKTLSSSEMSTKTSKNNIVRNMLTLLHKRSKQGVSSDPGIPTNNNNNIDIELLHMSRASVFTTSNDSECVKEFTKSHDSRTSL